MKERYLSHIVFFVLAFLFGMSLWVSWTESTTMDEQAHIPAAYTYMKYLDMRLNPEHPPLIKDLAGIPLLFLDVYFPTDSQEWQTGINAQWTLGNRFLHENNAHFITFLSRIPIILIAVLFGFFLYRWTRQLSGPLAGVLAVLFYAFNPNILAHSHYVTTDIGIAGAIFIALYFGIRAIEHPTKKNVVLFGIVLGLAQLTKFSAFLLYPFLGLITLLYAFAVSTSGTNLKETLRSFMRNITRYWGMLLIASLISLLPIWALYTFNTWNMPEEQLITLIETQLGEEGIPGIAKQFVLFISTLPILSSLAEYFLGLAMVFVRVTGGNTYFFLGEVSNVANPAYFPTVYLLKETLPVLISLIIALFTALILFIRTSHRVGSSLKKWKYTISHFIRHRFALLSMALFVLLYGYLSISGNLNIGFRHLFPILPFFYIFGALALVKILRLAQETKYRLMANAFFITITLWTIAIPLIHYPSYLSYYNELVGGPKNGYRYVTDSNYDWGQDLKNLKKWVETYNQCVPIRSPEACFSNRLNTSSLSFLPESSVSNTSSKQSIDKIRVDYFGGSNPQYWLGDMFIPWHDKKTPEPGWYAISSGFLQESIHKEKLSGEVSYEWLKDITPIGRAGDSIFIYYIQSQDIL